MLIFKYTRLFPAPLRLLVTRKDLPRARLQLIGENHPDGSSASAPLRLLVANELALAFPAGVS
ncbi:hypothetical protein [Salipaludibacillus aurantiacus]|uniref:hypothetical protein n=1 Tax=Salipaludibacillus aurantiacus TaxID=1601833 RepID=UPI0015A5D11F|nr:hypothetical protein [Salipaludibacillus aurantiacus]